MKRRSFTASLAIAIGCLVTRRGHSAVRHSRKIIVPVAGVRFSDPNSRLRPGDRVTAVAAVHEEKMCYRIITENDLCIGYVPAASVSEFGGHERIVGGILAADHDAVPWKRYTAEFQVTSA